ncbi:hypothetical protein HDU91_003505, partial [Kappamyces sp. JEL0680]
MTYHFIQTATILIIVPSVSRATGTLSVMVNDWSAYVPVWWCAFDALATFLSCISLLFMGLMGCYIPMSIFVSVKYPALKKIMDPAKMTTSVILAVLGIPTFLTSIYAGYAFSSPSVESAFTLSEWHCSLNYQNFAWFERILLAVEFGGGFLSLAFSMVSIYFMLVLRKDTIKAIGLCIIPDDLIMRSFLLGFICLFVDFVFGVDTILNLADPSIGIYNGVPYVLIISLSTFGSTSLVLWGATCDLIDYIPFIRGALLKVQESMKKSLDFLHMNRSKHSETKIKSLVGEQSYTLSDEVP